MTADMGGLYPAFRNRVNALLHDQEAQAMGVTVVSAFRSVAKQSELFAAAVRKYGSQAAARKWVAPPGHSNHGPRIDAAGNEPGPFGVAVDFGVRGVHATSGQWPQALDTRMQALGHRYGLKRPMAWEDWHYEFDPNVKTSWDAGTDHAPQPASQQEDDVAQPITFDAEGVVCVALPDNADKFHTGQLRWRRVPDPTRLRQLVEDGLVGSGQPKTRDKAYIDRTLGFGSTVS